MISRVILSLKQVFFEYPIIILSLVANFSKRDNHTATKTERTPIQADNNWRKTKSSEDFMQVKVESPELIRKASLRFSKLTN